LNSRLLNSRDFNIGELDFTKSELGRWVVPYDPHTAEPGENFDLDISEPGRPRILGLRRRDINEPSFTGPTHTNSKDTDSEESTSLADTRLSKLCDQCQQISRHLSMADTFNIDFKISLRQSDDCEFCPILFAEFPPHDLAELRKKPFPSLNFDAYGCGTFHHGAFIWTRWKLVFSLPHNNGREYRKFEASFNGEESTKLEASFDLEIIDGEPPTSVIKPEISLTTESEVNWDLARTWLDGCRQNHSCGIAETKKLPTRLIYVGLADSDLRLCLSNLLQVGTEYCTLSHCWGNQVLVKLQRNNLHLLQENIPVEALPKTFKEAFIAARRLGFQYMWIDSLCIIQDHETDWAREASTMADVYAGSGLNFAATAAEDSTRGCFFKHDPRLCRPLYIKIRKDPRVFLLVKANLWKEGVENSPLVRRGWVVQERILAPRTLHFGANQLYWECGKHTACETFPESSSSLTWGMAAHFLKGSVQAQPEWWRIVQHYSRTNLTKTRDKLVAVSGVARFMQQSTMDQYVAGLWRTNLEDQLLWQANFDAVIPHAPKIRRPQPYRAPSWSWASIDGPIHWYSRDTPLNSDHVWTSCISILKVFIEPLGLDPFGEVKSALLRIQCRPLLIGRLAFGSRPRHQPKILIGETEVLSCSFDEKPAPKEEGKKCLMLAIKTRSYSIALYPGDWQVVDGLLLEATGRKGEYRRVGTFNINRHIPSFGDMFLKTPALDIEDAFECVLKSNNDGGMQCIIKLI
jgi:hypothetical protein